jgi:hypothetical protein
VIVQALWLSVQASSSLGPTPKVMDPTMITKNCLGGSGFTRCENALRPSRVWLNRTCNQYYPYYLYAGFSLFSILALI